MAYIGKQEPEGRERNRGPKRRWTIPAPPGLSPCGLEARQILEEVSGPLGVELWQRFRDAVVWNAVSPGDRHHLFLKTTYLRDPAFADAAAEAVEIHPALAAFAELIGSARAVDARALAKASVSISEWATLHGYEETAALYAGLAARLRPRDPDLAFSAGRAERRCGRYERAEEWFLRAIGLSRRAGDDAAYASAFLGWGLMEEQRGRRASARQKYVRAWRAAMRGSFHQLGAAARHNLIALSVPDEPFDVGLAHVIAAYKLYDDSSPERLALLALDAGVFFAEHGFYAHALRLYDALARHIARPAVQVALLANVARAAAAVGDRDRFRMAYETVKREDAQKGEFAPAALAEIARAAHTLGLDGKAIATANEALKIARSRGMAGAERAALDVIEAVREKRAGDVPREPPPRVVRFVNRFVRRLEPLSSMES
ncbi:MAG TPA: tetratricopeptide repeat protein [Longimicrobium sp.]|uniref:tetratricopeptide repeat protein n=1 Tax=Longimicrobium sp. TaxID=2029185 RepID=UPI002ED975AC